MNPEQQAMWNNVFHNRFVHTALASVFALVVSSGSAQAVDVEEVIWGFDGKVIPYQFNPLSIRVSNPSNDVFEGVIELRRSLSGGQYVGASLVEEVYLSPNASRWVQFYPYLSRDWDNWTVAWDKRRHSYDLPRPAPGKLSRILLEEPGTLSRLQAGIKRLPDDLFPPIVTATRSLHAVYLDHVPRWEEPRRKSFMDWLKMGGRVHLMQDGSGDYPMFSEDLAELNSPLARQNVGRGVVFRHARGRDRFNDEFILNTEQMEKRYEESFASDDDLEVTRGAEANSSDQKTAPMGYGAWDSDTAFFNIMKSVTEPEHNWALIYFLSVTYILVVFPGCYWIGRRRVHYLTTYAAILGAVALFSLAFHTVGRRGYGEETAVHSVAIATPIGDEAYEVTQWSNVFVTEGDFYSIRHQGKGGIYSTCQQVELVNGQVNGGQDGEFVVDIPPFSSRPFTHRVRVDQKPFSIELTSFSGGISRLQQFSVRIDDRFPQDVSKVHLLYGRRFYTLVRRDDQWHLSGAPLRPDDFLQLNDFHEYQYAMNPWYDDDREEKTTEERFLGLVRPLVARNLGITQTREIPDISLPLDRARMFIYTKMSDEFFVNNERLGNQFGYVLYCVDVLRSEAP